MRRVILGVFALPFILAPNFFVSCGSAYEDSVPRPEPVEASTPELAGTWVSKCTVPTGAEGTEPYVESFEITANMNATYTHTVFSANDCESSSKLRTRQLTGTILGGAEAASGSAVDGATPIDFKILRGTVTLHDDEEVAALSALKVCGETVAVDKEIETSAALCGENSGLTLGLGAVWYQVAKLSEDAVTLGSTADGVRTGLTASLRPTTLISAPLTKE